MILDAPEDAPVEPDFRRLHLRHRIASEQNGTGRQFLDLVAVNGGRVPAGRSASQQRMVSACFRRGDASGYACFHPGGHLAHPPACRGNRDLQSCAGAEGRNTRRKDPSHEVELMPDLGAVVIDVHRRSGQEDRIKLGQPIGRKIACRIVGGDRIVVWMPGCICSSVEA